MGPGIRVSERAAKTGAVALGFSFSIAHCVELYLALGFGSHGRRQEQAYFQGEEGRQEEDVGRVP